MKHVQSDILSTQLNAQEPDKENSTLIKHEAIEGTPFYVVEQEGKWFVTFNKYRVTEIINSDEMECNREHIELLLEAQRWNIMMRISGVMFELMSKELPLENK